MYTDSGRIDPKVRKYLWKQNPSLRGLRFVPIGVFSVLEALGCSGLEALGYRFGGGPWSLIWQPLPSLAVFAINYGAFLYFRGWYSRREPDRADPFGERDHGAFWASVGVSLAFLLVLGAAAGFAASAAGLVVAGWVFAYRAMYRQLWRGYAFLAVLLVPSSVLPPVLGLPMPEVLPTVFLGASGISFFLIGCFDHLTWMVWYRRGQRDVPQVEQ